MYGIDCHYNWTKQVLGYHYKNYFPSMISEINRLYSQIWKVTNHSGALLKRTQCLGAIINNILEILIYLGTSYRWAIGLYSSPMSTTMSQPFSNAGSLVRRILRSRKIITIVAIAILSRKIGMEIIQMWSKLRNENKYSNHASTIIILYYFIFYCILNFDP